MLDKENQERVQYSKARQWRGKYGQKSSSGAVWLMRWAAKAGDPSLRLKNGYAQDDKVV
jgi:hypothetical protein